MSATSSTQAGKRARPRKLRNVAGQIHLWLGLTVGFIFVLCGLTGSYLAFHQEIERAAIEQLRASPGTRPSSYEAVYQALRPLASAERGDWNIELPENGGVITSRLPGKDGPRMVSLDPVTLHVVRDVQWGGTVSTWLYEFHYHLLMGRSGATVMGIIGLAVMVLLALGLVLWWRSGRSMRSRLAVHMHGTRERKVYDAHRLIGAASLVLLFISVATAVAMSLPKQVRPALAMMSPISRLPEPVSELAHGRVRLTVDRALSIARTVRPDGEVRWVKAPAKEDGAYLVRFWQVGEPSLRFPKSSIWIDQYDGRVLAIHDAPNGTASDLILRWLYPLHGGEAFGVVGRSVVGLLGMAPAILFVTGLLRWRSKQARLSAQRISRARRDAKDATITK